MMNTSFIQTCGHNIKDPTFAVIYKVFDNIVSGKMARTYEDTPSKTTKGYQKSFSPEGGYGASVS